MKKIQVTQEGFDALKAELKRLIEVDRPALLVRLTNARAMGDLRENSEYTASKEEQGLIEGRIRELEELIKHAEVVAVNAENGTVQLGSAVHVDNNGKEEIYHIVGEFEADPMNKKLSQTSPIGKALMGKQIGETVEIEVPAGKMVFKVVDITTS